jgi:hypothetical protein
VRRMLESGSGAEAELDAAVRIDPELVLAYAALVFASRDAARTARLRSRAEELAPRTTTREQRHIGLMIGLATRRHRVMEEATEYLQEFPRDALVLEHTLRHMFFFGGPGRAARALALVASCGRAYPADDWYFPARHAFYLQELHQLDEAEPLARLAVERNPDNGNATHALVHVLHGRGWHDEARAVLLAALARYDGLFRSHFRWHVGIVELATATPTNDPSGTLATFDAHLAPGRGSGPAHLAFADAVGFLASCELAGIDVSSRWPMLRPMIAQLAAAEGQPFVAAHMAIAFDALGDRAALDALVARLDAADTQTSRWGLPIVRAIAAHSVERLLELDESQREAMGGSLVERHILDEVAVALCARNPGPGDALAGLRERYAARAPVHPVLARLAGTRP